MHRLLGLRGRSLSSDWATLGLRCAPAGRLLCGLCGRATLPADFDRLQIRHRSSAINNVTISSLGKKKFRRKAKKYAELLEVADFVTNDTKAAVQKLSAADLSVLVNQPDINLDELHKIKNKNGLKKGKKESKSIIRSNSTRSSSDQISSPSNTSFKNFPTTISVDLCDHKDESLHLDETNVEMLAEDLKASGITDESIIIKSSYASDAFDESTTGLEKSEDLPLVELSEEKISDNERKAKEALIREDKLKQFNKAILGFVNVSVNSDMPISKHRWNKWKKSLKSIDSLYINDINVYNLYIEKLASASDLNSILSILQVVKSQDIKYNVQTYTNIFYCISNMNLDANKKLEILKQISIEMDNDGISLNDIMTKSTFVRDQRKLVEEMVKMLDSDIKLVYEVPDTNYDCRLLENLSEDSAKAVSTTDGLLNLNDLNDRLKKQIEAEIEGQINVLSIAKKNTSVPNIAHLRHKLSNLERHWEKVALKAFRRNLSILKSEEIFKRSRKILLYPYLAILKPEDYVRVLMREVKRLGMGSEMYSLPLNSLCRNLGIQVYKVYETKMKSKNGVINKTSEVYKQYCDWFINRNDKHNCRVKWMLLEHEANKSGVTLNAEIPTWQNNIHVGIGKFLYNIIVNDLKIDASILKKQKDHRGFNAPAFFTVYRHSNKLLKEEVKPHPIVTKLYKDSQPETLTFDTTVVPSLCPPRPWTSIYYGGYIVTKTDIVRVTQNGFQQWQRLLDAPPKKLYPSLDSLNQLGSIPWAVNKSVLDVAIKVFQNDGSIELNMPQPPTILAPIPPAPKDTDPEEKKKIDKARMDLKRRKNEMYSLWCDALYRLSLANHFRNEIFWLPHNMDFRGRVYPIPPHLNHLGSDLARSMLVFALKKPLGPQGLDWLKLHAINLTGFKKKSPVRERLQFANKIMDKILDSAEKPLTGEMWWATSDEPWQTLATCMEIAAALKSPDPTKYMSGFPIHQDGSCNGLQHYAALGRDQIGAESVNLYPFDAPQDVYSSVAAMVDERRKEDAENPLSQYHNTAKVLEGFVKRKVIKQTVMTTVYGVTRYGARLQIARQLKDLDNFPADEVRPASTYLVQKTFETLRTMFKSAREIQDWFTECARLVCFSRNENMEWQTPLGLPVIQPYSKIKKSSSNNNNNNISVLFSADTFRRPNLMKQKNAFAPNFVHSLDSSHMMLTSIHSEHAGITFVSVHDCYWTHPCTVEIMNKICREQFIALHSEPILEDLSNFLIEKFGFPESDCEYNELTDGNINMKIISMKQLRAKLNTTLRQVPKQGDFDLQKVMQSTYFFS